MEQIIYSSNITDLLNTNTNTNTNTETKNKPKTKINKINKIKKPKILLEFVEEPSTNISLYSIAHSPYISSEYISPSIIPLTMNHFFPSSELSLSYNENHGIYKIMINDLLGDNINNWEYNRPPDMARCPDIARSLYISRNPVDTMIFLSYNNKKEVFEVLDGIHRLTSLKIIKVENSKPINLLENCEFGSGNDAKWLFSQYLLVNIRFNASQGDLINVFKNLNKNQAVPELYIRDYSREKRNIIDDIVNEWYAKYKRHFSSSANPITGNTNRNNFVNLLDKLYEKHKIRDTTSDKLNKKLKDANTSIQNSIPSKVSIDIRLKCKESGCFLFLYKNERLEEII